ncbi:MAG: exonuclease SbcCD subunit D [Lachnospiraceae bacterium]|nr:exonuclease SbcCD subunit D [Lachnospiraceae bacterium]
MKFFHLSDLHIGLKLMNRDLREDQEYIFRQITEIAGREKPDAVVIAGDIYDKAVPSAEAVEVFDRFIGELREAVPDAVIMMISGNHDSASRVNCFRNVLSRQNLYMVGQPPRTQEEHIEKVTCTDEYGQVHFYLLPFVKPSMVKGVVGVDENGNNFSYEESLRRLIAREEIDTDARNVLVSHQFYLPGSGEQEKLAEGIERMDSEVRTVGNIDAVSADVLSGFDYVALGHLHKPMKVGSERIRYCGTPLACSVSEAGQEKGIVVVELGEKESSSLAHEMKNMVSELNDADSEMSDTLNGPDGMDGEMNGTSHGLSDADSEMSDTLQGPSGIDDVMDGVPGGSNGTITDDAVREGCVPEADEAGAKIRTSVIPLVPLREVRIIRGNLEEVLKQSCQDYVTVILTDKTDLKVMDMQERLRLAFPNLLEIRRETVRTADYSYEIGTAAEEGLDPYELCCAFLKDADEAEKEILRDVIRTVMETSADDSSAYRLPYSYREPSGKADGNADEAGRKAAGREVTR